MNAGAFLKTLPLSKGEYPPQGGGRECVDPDRSYAPALRAPPLPKRGSFCLLNSGRQVVSPP